MPKNQVIEMQNLVVSLAAIEEIYEKKSFNKTAKSAMIQKNTKTNNLPGIVTWLYIDAEAFKDLKIVVMEFKKERCIYH